MTQQYRVSGLPYTSAKEILILASDEEPALFSKPLIGQPYRSEPRFHSVTEPKRIYALK